MFMLKSTHEAAIKHLVETRNKALTDLSGATFKVESLESDLRAANKDADEWKGAALRCGEAVERLETEIAALRPDAEAMRAKRKRDRELKAEKAKAAAAPKAASKKAVGK